MRHFGHISPAVREALFFREPREFDAGSPSRMLSAALGATLYSPATRPRLADDVIRQSGRGVVSMVLCLEDSIDDAEVVGAEANLVRQFADIEARDADVPLLFIRVREPEQILDLVRRLGSSVRLLSGFVLPKFTEERGELFMEALTAAEAESGHRLFAMPVLESPELLHLETRGETLRGIARTVDKYRERVLALRLGVTDFCSAYGLRRAPDMTAYDVQIVGAVIGDVVNVLGRADGTGFTITGPVWEYFRLQERMFKPQLRRSLHGRGRGTAQRAHRARPRRAAARDRARPGQRAARQDLHPPVARGPVHALSVVSHEEYCDAQDILRPERGGGGVLRSAYTNKMNEVKPHRAWAERTLQRAEVFGVAREEVGFVDLLAAGVAA